MGEDQDLICMFDSCIALEKDAKQINEEIKETLETYATNKEIPVKAVKEVFKKYKEYQKNPADFVLIDFECDRLLNAIVPEYAKEGA